jgi:hypothetical protein
MKIIAFLLCLTFGLANSYCLGDDRKKKEWLLIVDSESNTHFFWTVVEISTVKKGFDSGDPFTPELQQLYEELERRTGLAVVLGPRTLLNVDLPDGAGNVVPFQDTDSLELISNVISNTIPESNLKFGFKILAPISSIVYGKDCGYVSNVCTLKLREVEADWTVAHLLSLTAKIGGLVDSASALPVEDADENNISHI